MRYREILQTLDETRLDVTILAAKRFGTVQKSNEIDVPDIFRYLWSLVTYLEENTTSSCPSKQCYNKTSLIKSDVSRKSSKKRDSMLQSQYQLLIRQSVLSIDTNNSGNGLHRIGDKQLYEQMITKFNGTNIQPAMSQTTVTPLGPYNHVLRSLILNYYRYFNLFRKQLPYMLDILSIKGEIQNRC